MWIKDDLQTDSTWAFMDALESIITPIFLAVDVATMVLVVEQPIGLVRGNQCMG